MVIYGGIAGPVPPQDGLDDTWEWDGVAWRRVEATGPGARDHVALAHDVEGGAVVLVGAVSGAAVNPFDCWAWNGAAWSRVSADAPHVVQPVMVTDVARRRVLLYGGFTPGGTPKNELWEWRAGSWTRL